MEVTKLEGRGRLRFTRKEETSWSFAFLEVCLINLQDVIVVVVVQPPSVLPPSQDPRLELKVKSLFEGRGYPHLSSIIESQVSSEGEG